MKVIEDAFTIIHIRISGVKILGISARHVITGLLTVFLFTNGIRIFTSIFDMSFLSILESGFFIIITVFIALMWIKAWSKAGKMLNKAVGYEEKDDKGRKNNSKK